ncbi:hypothetical protein PAXINDRAFT_14681 [Paxillus involutus ATCC 200175]|uniref:Unplaced genomic scaffold PAXINscaffold_41, whole genome shotgun sequence n=1 Tax=Paxillus involutus ATCC 200175 TaxID=664439 RepID=A0A0C9TYV0_PAXIN|nr:hypothetical protein PAXINDRAFT_14681 [Paxillus involutus ATCC 200175]
MSVGLATPMGRSYGPPNTSNEGEKGGEEDEKGEWVSGIESPSSNDDGGDEDVRHAYVVPTSTLPPPYHALPTPDERQRPLSMPLKGEMTGVVNPTTMKDAVQRDVEQRGPRRGNDTPPPQPPSPPTPPALPPHPERHDHIDHMKSNKTPAQTRADAVHDPGSEMDSSGNKPPSVRLEGESSKRSSLHVETDNIETEDDDLKSSKMAARMRADALHDPGGQTNSPGSKPPSVGLEGERIKWSSLHVETNDHNTQQLPRRPVGTTDGDERCPNGPTEPPDEEKGADGGYSEQEVELTVEHVETNEPGRVEVKEVEHIKGVEDVKDVESRESRRGDEPRGRGGNGVETREVEGEERGQSKDDGCQRDGRTCDTGSTMFLTIHLDV